MANKVKKSSEGYGYKYADLAAVTEYIEGIHGSYYQYTATDPIDHKTYVWTHRAKDDQIDKAIEVRGAEVVSATLSNGKQNPAQAAGSAMTYARRYSLYMAYGLACVDDDAESLTIPDDAGKIESDFTAATTNMSRKRSGVRAEIVTYCNEHGLDLYTISDQYGIVRGMSEDELREKLNLIKQDHGE